MDSIGSMAVFGVDPVGFGLIYSGQLVFGTRSFENDTILSKSNANTGQFVLLMFEPHKNHRLSTLWNPALVGSTYHQIFLLMLHMQIYDSTRMETLNYQYAGQERMDKRQGYGGSKRSRYEDVDPRMHMSQPPSKRIVQGSQNGSYDWRKTLPPGWLECTPYGDALNFIIPSKVPLQESFNDKIVIDKRYSPQHAILQQRHLGRELGLVIDLTNTDRYYRESDWTRQGIEYVKIRCAGRDSVPDNESVERFIQELLRKFIPRLSHASDGLIFQPCGDPYVSGRDEFLLKWKYPEMNSVDFLLEVGNNNRPMLYLIKRDRMELVSGSRCTFRDSSVDIFSLSGKIIECSWDFEEKVWVFMRMRPDKSTPNGFSTYVNVKRSIEDNITKEVVINEIQDIIHLPMYKG
ncbi:hypothetical protein CTI12_AA457530 [Artemisia annua]|uniref:mRNA guanylyltransferase n=1 Tax=Artemisia annua TaxID=35608 RepID=A0A2U1LL53_ARTAN|nr:hypothetical protein CTI12_AA457530 [Artemisia annua]